MNVCHRGAVAALLLALAVLALAPAAGLASAAPVPPPRNPNGFYVSPAVLPSDNGALIRSMPTGLLAGLASFAAKATRIMYRSEDAEGSPIAVTGTVLEPTASWRGKGLRPLVSYAVGTHGAGDSCAPSKLLAEGVTVDGSGVPFAEVQASGIAMLLAEGVTVAVTDYPGLGTWGVHPYLQPLPAAHAVLDVARAAIRLGVVRPQAPIGIWGSSQGGAAAAAAAEQAHGYAPDLDVRGVAAAGVVANPATVLDRLDGTLLSGVIGYFVSGLIAEYPRLTAPVMAILNNRGREFLRRTSTQCVPSTALGDGFRPTSVYTASGRTIGAALRASPPVAAVLSSFVLGRIPPTAPVLVMHNANDDVVPAGPTSSMVRDWRTGGSDITISDVDSPPLLPQVGIFGHAATEVGAATAVHWLTTRLADPS